MTAYLSALSSASDQIRWNSVCSSFSFSYAGGGNNDLSRISTDFPKFPYAMIRSSFSWMFAVPVLVLRRTEEVYKTSCVCRMSETRSRCCLTFSWSRPFLFYASLRFLFLFYTLTLFLPRELPQPLYSWIMRHSLGWPMGV